MKKLLSIALSLCLLLSDALADVTLTKVYKTDDLVSNTFHNGFVTGNGKTYYYADGVRAKGLTKIGEDYYFFNAGSGMMYKDANMWVPANDYGVEPGMHYFDAEGRMTGK